MPANKKPFGVPSQWQWQELALAEEYRQHSKGLERWLPRGSTAWSGSSDGQVFARLIIEKNAVTAVIVAGLPAAQRQEVLRNLEPLNRKKQTWTEQQAARNIVKQSVKQSVKQQKKGA